MRKSLRVNRLCIPCKATLPEPQVEAHMVSPDHLRNERIWKGDMAINHAIRVVGG